MELFFAVLLFAVSTTVTPGPNNIMVMASGVNFGVRRTLPHFLGICLGFPSMVAAVGLGLGTVFAQAPALHVIVKAVGVTYMLYLAWKIAMTDTSIRANKDVKPMTFWQAAVFQWVNPKAWIMAIGAVAAFTTVSGDMSAQVAVIALAFFSVSFPCVGVWMLCGAILQKVLTQPKQQRVFNLTMSFLLVASIMPMIASNLSDVPV
ncbi:LysE family translocator [Hahella aquimaris]|uniref:LysE family translocator n=1 Tax=Hahella sp. HNIBRBA332 TaxID=3015983 RepID=UPI00273C6B36|nr:LysE family translocator [Hahella sp. HNIBRBA332]WLQ12882.1 LysE family translocator [Hahella sp. HNIBRBA332]